MSRRKLNFVEGAYYHIYNRGNNKQRIFQDRQDYEYFLKLIFLANGEKKFRTSSFNVAGYGSDRGNEIINIGAYCLMPNHFHLLVIQKNKNGVTKFMHKTSSGYSHYYNKKYNRTGVLFEGKFKSEYVDDDIYLKYLFSYIHLNPVKLVQKDWRERGIRNKLEVINFLKDYKYSSFGDYLGFSRKENKIINKKFFPDYFPTSKIFIEEIFDWLKIGL